MTYASEVVDYIQSSLNVDLKETKMHKLLYYIQGWSLAWTGKPLFEDEIQAWRHGPVVPSIYHRKPHQTTCPQQFNLNAEQIGIIDSVVELYGGMGSRKLVELTHAESPWRDTWGDCDFNERGNDPISHVAMRREFTRQAMQGKGPVQKQPIYQEISDDELETTLDKACRDWEHTLALLAQ